LAKDGRMALVSKEGPLSIARQCLLLGLSRSSFYYEPCSESQLNLELMQRIDKLHLLFPFYGVRRMTQLYYITVMIMYFRKDLPQYLPKQLKPEARSVSFNSQDKANEEADIFTLGGKTAAAIKRHIRDDNNKLQSQKELLFSLHLILQSFAILRYTPFEQAINNLIATEVDEQFSFNLEEEELNSVWLG
jgi:hypothetical protein